MKLYRLIVLAAILIISASGFAQSGKIRKANRLYEAYNYSDAAERFNELEYKDAEALRKEAESLLYYGNYAGAEVLFLQLVQSESKLPIDHYHYSYVLRVNKKYQESDEQLKIFYSLNSDDSRAGQLIMDENYFSRISVDESRYNISNLNFNTSAQEFSPSYYNDGIVFTSSRVKMGASIRIYNRNKQPFLNMYYSENSNGSSFANPQQFWKRINKKYHDGPSVFYNKFSKIVFTRNYYDEKSTAGSRNLKIYFAEKDGDSWTKPTEFAYNNKEYSVGHPYITEDGKTMYFVSDMPGGIGGTDIYITILQADNTWSKPENLGQIINTEGNEMFPFLSSKGNLIFSSDGHLGLGGLDLFITNPELTKVINMGVPLNTNADDFGFIADAEMKTGYFSSNRSDGRGDDDIYSVNILKPFTFGKIIKGTAFDTEGKILAETKVVLKDDSGKTISEVVTGADGCYSFNVPADQDFVLNGTKLDYFDGNKTASTKTSENEIIADLILQKDPGLWLYALVTDSKTKEKIEGAEITLKDITTGQSFNFITPVSGDFTKTLEDKKLNDKANYQIILKREGYFTKELDLSMEFNHPGQYDLHLMLDFSMDQEVKDLTELVKINPIYFDLDKYNIRPDAAVELDKIVEIMNKYPNMVVELGSHTDCRASAAYNLRLSDNRAKASAEYIKGKIVNPERITGKGYGESKLINKCECEGAKVVPCTEEEHQLNRRTEFKVISTGNDKVKVVD
jgi:outer membrane protein OmpA-like peptidoglycan-associated protein